MVAAPGETGGEIRGECPSAHEPFSEVDGLLARVRTPGGVVAVAGWDALAALSAGGLISVVEITNRANLQLRGIEPANHAAVLDRLVESGLVLADGAADIRRNVMASPTAGFDPDELIDTRRVVTAIADRLARRAPVGLSPKFGVIVDGGGSVHVRGRRQSLAFGALVAPSGAVMFEVRIGAPVPVAVADDELLALVAPADVLTAIDAAIDLGGEVSAAALLDLLHHRLGAHMRTCPAGACKRSSAPSASAVGLVEQRGSGVVAVGVAPILGRLDPAAVVGVAAVLDEFGLAEVRLTPDRGLLVPNVVADAAEAVQARFSALGFVTEADDPARRVLACAGATGCAAATVDTQRDARTIIAALRSGPVDAPDGSIHVSGCEKRCASRATHAVTLVGDAEGRYVADAVELELLNRARRGLLRGIPLSEGGR